MTMTRRSNNLMHIFRPRQTSPMKSTTFAITLNFGNWPKHVNLVTLIEIKEHIILTCGSNSLRRRALRQNLTLAAL